VLFTRGTRAWCYTRLYYTYKIASVFQIMGFYMTYSSCTHKKIRKKSISTPPPLFVTCCTFLLPSMHIYVIYLDRWNLILKKGRLLCVRFDTIMYSLQYGCHLFEYTWENVEHNFKYLMWPVQKSHAPYMKHI
jgi:hypothetical protein